MTNSCKELLHYSLIQSNQFKNFKQSQIQTYVRENICAYDNTNSDCTSDTQTQHKPRLKASYKWMLK